MPMWVYDLTTLYFIAVNEAAIRDYGYSREEFLGMTIKDMRPPEDVPELLRHVSKLGAGLARSGIWRHRKKDGTILFAEVISHGIEYGGKQVRLVLANNITERKKIDEALQQSEQRYRSLVEMPRMSFTVFLRRGSSLAEPLF